MTYRRFPEEHGCCIYKCFFTYDWQLSDDERTPAVIRTCLEKRDMEGDPSEYILVQVLSNGGKCVNQQAINPSIYIVLNSGR